MHDQEGQLRQQKPTVPEEKPHKSPGETERVTHDRDTEKTKTNNREEDEQNTETFVLPATCLPATKWIDLISTDREHKRSNDKQGKKREQSKLTKDTTNDDIDVDENIEDANRYHQAQAMSPKRSKKIKVDRDPKASRERTRSHSR